MSETKVNGAAFKLLIDAVKRFPSVGGFVGSDLINLQVSKDGTKLQASTFGVVVSRGTVDAVGEMPLIAVDERALIPFAGLCDSKSNVVIKVSDKVVQFRTRNREITSANVTGQDHQIPPLKGIVPLIISETVAVSIAYLAQIAMNDSSRPELNCVMLSNGDAMASDQKAVVSLKLAVPYTGRTALPVPIAKAIRAGDRLYSGAKETILISGIGQHAMPSPVRAQKEFPVSKIASLSALEKTGIAVIAGDKLKSALEECGACLGNIARNEVVVKLAFKNGELELSAQNGGIKFRRMVTVKEKMAADVYLPLEESLNAAALMNEKLITVSQGTNGATFLSFKSGWALFPKWTVK